MTLDALIKHGFMVTLPFGLVDSGGLSLLLGKFDDGPCDPLPYFAEISAPSGPEKASGNGHSSAEAIWAMCGEAGPCPDDEEAVMERLHKFLADSGFYCCRKQWAEAA